MADPADVTARRSGEADVERRLAELDDLLGRVEQIPGPAGELALEAVAAVAEIYGAALARALAHAAAPAGGVPAADAMVADPLLGHLLLLHGLHPDPAEVRIGRALDEVRSRLGAHGGQVALSGIADGVAEVRLAPGGGCGCSSSSGEVAEGVREAVLAAAPELSDVRVVAAEPARPAAFVPLTSLVGARR